MTAQPESIVSGFWVWPGKNSGGMTDDLQLLELDSIFRPRMANLEILLSEDFMATCSTPTHFLF
jgi:hypothetical protein